MKSCKRPNVLKISDLLSNHDFLRNLCAFISNILGLPFPTTGTIKDLRTGLQSIQSHVIQNWTSIFDRCKKRKC